MSNISYLLNGESLQIGGRVFTDLANLKVLFGANNGSSFPYCTPREQFQTSGYVVPAGKQFEIGAIRVQQNGDHAPATGEALSIGYSTSDVGIASSSAGNRTELAGNVHAGKAVVNGVLSNFIEVSCHIIIPAGTYVSLHSVMAADNSFHFYGYEKDA